MNRPTWSLLDALLAPLRADSAAAVDTAARGVSSHASAGDAEMTEAVSSPSSSSSSQSPPPAGAALDPASNGSLGATASMSAVDAAARIASFDLFHLFALLERALPYAAPSNGGSHSAGGSGNHHGSSDTASARFDRAFHLRHALRVLLAFRAAQTVAHALAARSGTVAPPWLQGRPGQASTASAWEASMAVSLVDPLPLIDEQHAQSAKWTNAFDSQRASADAERDTASEALESDRQLNAHVLRLARCAANPAMNVNAIGANASASATGSDQSDVSSLSTACCSVSVADLTSHLLPLLRQAALLLHVCDVGFALSSATADDSGAASARSPSSSGSALPAAAPALRRLISNIADAPVSSSSAAGAHSRADWWLRAPTHVEREFAALANAIGLPLSVGDLLGADTTSNGRCEPVDADAVAARRVFAQSLHAIWQFEAAERSTLIDRLRLGGNINGTNAHLSALAAASANFASLYPTAERRLIAARSLPLLRLAPAALIPLPRDYSDLFQWLTDARCAQCQTVPREPALCLVCGQLLCAATQCCRSNSQGARRISLCISRFSYNSISHTVRVSDSRTGYSFFEAT
jgi:hypothetical protein